MLVITKDIGGQALNAWKVENYSGLNEISGIDLIKKFKSHADQFKIEFKGGLNVIQIKKKNNLFEIICDGNKSFKSKSVIIATGKKPRNLGVKGEKELIGRGVAYCATCDAPLFKNKDVAVIGGGNAALQSVLQLENYANKIYIIDIELKFRGDEILQDKIRKNQNIEILQNCKVLEIFGDKFVEGLKYQSLSMEEEREIKLQGIFIEIGSIPNSDFVKDILDLNEFGEIKIDKNNSTSINGIFAAGDATDIESKQIIISSGEGAKAALSAYKYLSFKK